MKRLGQILILAIVASSFCASQNAVAQTSAVLPGRTIVDANGARVGTMDFPNILIKVDGETVVFGGRVRANQLYYSDTPPQLLYTTTDCTGQAYIYVPSDLDIVAWVIPPNIADYPTLLGKPVTSALDLVYPTRPFSTITVRSGPFSDGVQAPICLQFSPTFDNYAGTMKVVHSNAFGGFTPPFSLQ